MHQYLRYGFIENLDTVRHIPLGQFWGVRVSVTPITWLGPFVFVGLRLALNALGPALSLAETLYDAWVFTLAVEMTTLIAFRGWAGHLARSIALRPPEILIDKPTPPENAFLT